MVNVYTTFSSFDDVFKGLPIEIYTYEDLVKSGRKYTDSLKEMDMMISSAPYHTGVQGGRFLGISKQLYMFLKANPQFDVFHYNDEKHLFEQKTNVYESDASSADYRIYFGLAPNPSRTFTVNEFKELINSLEVRKNSKEQSQNPRVKVKKTVTIMGNNLIIARKLGLI